MPISYVWSFPTLDVVYNEGGFQNVVKTVHWIYTATEDTYSSYACGATTLESPGQSFTSYDDLTPEIVTGWVVSTLGQEKMDHMETMLASEIESQKTPTSGPMPPPWS